jgi:hypothetical protein
MKCSICGSENNGTKFCTSCGAKLYAADDTAALKTEDTEVKIDNTEEAYASSDLGKAEASAAEAASELDNAAGEALHTMTGAYSQDNGGAAGNGAPDNAGTNTDANTNAYSQADSQGSSNYYDAGYQGGTSYDDTYAEGGGNIGFAIASMICGILSMLCCICGCMNLPLSIAAIVLGVITITKHYDGKGMAIAGLITGGLGLVLGVIMTGVGMTDEEVRDSMTDIFNL